MKKKFYLLFNLPILLATISCRNSSSEIDVQKHKLDVLDVDPFLKNSSDYLSYFSTASEKEISITMYQNSANFVNDYQHYSSSSFNDYYVPCDVKLLMDGNTFEFNEVGFRLKGNTSRVHCLQDGNFSVYSLFNFKLKFNSTFDGDEYSTVNEIKQFRKNWDNDNDRQQRKNRKFFDMEKLDFKWNRNNDGTRSRQAFAYSLFNKEKVLSPRSTILKVNLSIYGKTGISAIYDSIEVIDEAFISRHFSEKYMNGDLYKCCWQNAEANFNKNYTINNEIGIEDVENNYHPAYDLKTNKKKHKDHQNLLNLLNIMNQDNLTSNQFYEKIDNVIDIASFTRLEAICFLAGNFDDMRNNSNNYYLYFTSETNFAYFIPYDFDRCFGCGDCGHDMTSYSADSTKKQCTGQFQNISLYWRTICRPTDGFPSRVGKYYQMYQKEIEKLVNEKLISLDNFKNFVNSFPSMVRGKYESSGEAWDNTTYESYIISKINNLKRTNPEYNILEN